MQLYFYCTVGTFTVSWWGNLHHRCQERTVWGSERDAWPLSLCTIFVSFGNFIFYKTEVSMIRLCRYTVRSWELHKWAPMIWTIVVFLVNEWYKLFVTLLEFVLFYVLLPADRYERILYRRLFSKPLRPIFTIQVCFAQSWRKYTNPFVTQRPKCSRYRVWRSHYGELLSVIRHVARGGGGGGRKLPGAKVTPTQN